MKKKKKKNGSTYRFWFEGNDSYKTLSELTMDELKSCVEALGVVLSETGGKTPKDLLKQTLKDHLEETEFVFSDSDWSESLQPQSNSAPRPKVNILIK